MTDADQAAVLRVIHDTHSKALLRYVLSLTHGDMPFAQDVVQESLLRLWRKPDMLEQSSDGIRAWLFTVARNQVIDDRRSARYTRELRTAEMPEQASPDGRSDPREAADAPGSAGVDPRWPAAVH